MSNKPKEYKRLQIDLTLESFDRMEKMKDMAGLSSYTQVIGRSLHAYEFLLKHQSSDKKLMLIDEKGNQTEIVLL